ncbi:MAG TPA: serine/threonine-protein kinase [Polyangia bacterium]|jgi:serine/threonine protein kinase
MPVAGVVQMRDRLDRYTLVEHIGRGGMAEVFRARVQSLGGFERDVAVKVLLPQFANEPEFVDMLLDEARIAGGIVHPCVVQVIDVGRQGEIFYIVMEYVRGLDLRAIARSVPGAKLPLPMTLYVIGEVLRGLHAVHSAVDDRGQPRRIVHRDVSPANVMLDDNGAVKLGDFGIAHASGRLTRTRTGSVKGKSRYMAPEQLTGQPVDHRADLYAVGVTLFESLLGDVARESSYATPYGPMFTWPRRVPPELVPADVAEILRRAVVDDPRQRFADAAQFRRAVVTALGRHAPGYDAETLANDLARLRGELVDFGGAAIGDGEDAATELRADRPRLSIVTTPLPPPISRRLDRTPTATHSVTPSTHSAPIGVRTLPSPEPLYADGDLLGPRPSRGLLLAIAAAVGTAILIAIVIAVSSGAAPRLPPPETAATTAAPHATPLAPPHASNGILEIAGPPGARPSIGAVYYPPAPCTLELPPGEYDVRLHARRRVIARHVIIEAGHTTSL